ncbi:MAG: hypothetical protein JWP20_2426 [Roseomonas sp.]|nr:hypothetical protein [Roseomonas sp.]
MPHPSRATFPPRPPPLAPANDRRLLARRPGTAPRAWSRLDEAAGTPLPFALLFPLLWATGFRD